MCRTESEGCAEQTRAIDFYAMFFDRWNSFFCRRRSIKNVVCDEKETWQDFLLIALEQPVCISHSLEHFLRAEKLKFHRIVEKQKRVFFRALFGCFFWFFVPFVAMTTFSLFRETFTVLLVAQLSTIFFPWFGSERGIESEIWYHEGEGMKCFLSLIGDLLRAWFWENVSKTFMARYAKCLISSKCGSRPKRPKSFLTN